MQEFSPEWFDESSKAWRANKKRSGQSWKYLCSESLCKRVCVSGLRTCLAHSSSHLSSRAPNSEALLEVKHTGEVGEKGKGVKEERRSVRLASKLPS